MKLEFDNFQEIIKFLDDAGYKVTRKDDENDSELISVTKDFPKLNPNDLKDIPNPFSPSYPPYTTTPIVTYEAQNDPELSKKFITTL